ncbi:major facilitator superfamily domain-containing protein [Rhodocollybia butyracea]|uniref:Major facilitator superfamily domain-containing protein n=1 Tax=Rhodocollybia butyracea TaxID=206335 RepID=A0A9P5PS83_9AGAR|nr:major facilitator superfamily domain-containing protein [Rhodocollybia butyracea]
MDGQDRLRPPQNVPLEPHERTALLPRTRTPLPWSQLFVLFWVQLAEPLTSQVIYPFINKMVSELPITDGEESKTGYYVGLIESLFYVTQAMTSLYWSRLSDRIGRKPVIIIGLLGLTVSTGLFGVSRSFEGLILSRCLSGVLNGNAGTIKSMMGEITDETNVAQAMALLPIIWNTGATVAPVIGGWLSNPHEQFPALFPGDFWKIYPYALPCFVVAVYCFGSVMITLLYLDESMKHSSPTTSALESATTSHTSSGPTHLPLSQILTPKVRVAIIAYAVLAFLDIALRALQPLFLTTSPSFGGLGFSVPAVGTCLAAFFVGSGLYQAVAFTPLYEWMGPKKIYVVSMVTFVPIFTLFPMMRVSLDDRGSMNAVTWVELVIQLILYVIMDMAFSSALIYIRASAPNPYSLGATNGLAQTAVSIARAFGPVSTTSLFAVSVEIWLWSRSQWDDTWFKIVLAWLGGNLVYVVLILISIGAVAAAKRLPEKPTLGGGVDEVGVEQCP